MVWSSDALVEPEQLQPCLNYLLVWACGHLQRRLTADRWMYHCCCQNFLPLSIDFYYLIVGTLTWLLFTWYQLTFAKWSSHLVSAGTRAAPSAVGSATVTVMAQRTSVQRSSMLAPPLTPSQAHPWDQDATLQSWWAEILNPTVCDSVRLFPYLLLFLPFFFQLKPS